MGRPLSMAAAQVAATVAEQFAPGAGVRSLSSAELWRLQEPTPTAKEILDTLTSDQRADVTAQRAAWEAASGRQKHPKKLVVQYDRNNRAARMAHKRIIALESQTVAMRPGRGKGVLLPGKGRGKLASAVHRGRQRQARKLQRRAP